MNLPGWMRGVMAAFGFVFGLLAYWLAGMVGRVGLVTAVAVALLAGLALVFMVAALRGRAPKWLMFLP